MAKRFTLVEILMVSGMIALVAALILVGYNGVYRSWSSRNTIATMKAAQLALDKYRLEGGSFPISDDEGDDFVIAKTGDCESLARDLIQECAPYVRETGSNVTVFDDFGKETPLRYVYNLGNTMTVATKSFILISAGKDGVFNSADEDDIIFLPAGYSTLPPGFYMAQVREDGTIVTAIADVEPLAK